MTKFILIGINVLKTDLQQKDLEKNENEEKNRDKIPNKNMKRT